MPSTRIIAAATLAGALALTGCSNSTDTTSSGSATTQTEASQQAFNDADVTFAQQMIPHHRQAVQMATFAPDLGGNDDVRQLAATIEQAQGPEIDTMTEWLQTWGKDVPDATSSMGGMDHGATATDGMSGMMSDDDMTALRGTSGAGFDGMFLTMMIAHHQGAIEMAQTEQRDGENPDAIALAKKIEADQTAEIATMQAMLGS